MKKFLFAFLGLIILAVGCKTVEVTTTKDVPVTQKMGTPLQDLKQKYVDDLSAKDSTVFFQKTYFYNSEAIELELIIVDETKPFSVDDNGVAHKDNTDINLLKIVPQMTIGKIKDPTDVRFSKYNPSVITGIIMTFDSDDRTFRFKFTLVNNGTFSLIPEATLLYKNQTYSVKATTPPGSADCILKFYGDEKSNTIKITETAKGFIGKGNTNNPSPIKGNTNTEPVFKNEEIEW